MKTTTSVEFRKTYARLTEVTVVTANGHAIGIWYPGEREAFIELLRRGIPEGMSIAVPAEYDPTSIRTHTGHRDRDGKRKTQQGDRDGGRAIPEALLTEVDARLTAPSPRQQQAERDAILRKINRGG